MVNTFLVCSDFSKSAKLLDNPRLGKQRVEAFQILNLCYSLHVLAEHYSNPVPSDPYAYHSWIREIASRYKKEDYRLLVREDDLEYPDEWLQLKRDVKIYKQKPTEEVLEINPKSDTIIVKLIKTGRSKELVYSTFVSRNDLYITLGFVYHPAVPMWLGNETALEQYINAHIEEWEARGHHNTMRKYEVKKKYSLPQWCSDPDFHYSHKSNLITKERDRKEKAWYCNLKEFDDTDFGREYIWPYSEKYDTEKKYSQ